MPDNSNELFQSAVNSAVILNAILSLIGLACIFMGYRLLISRAERRAPGSVFALFGMLIIAIAMFRTVSEAPFGRTLEGTTSPATVREPAPTTQRSAWPPGNTTTDEQVATKVRDAAAPPVHFSPGNDVTPAQASEPARFRGAGVQTKGAYVPFPRASAPATNRYRIAGNPLAANVMERQLSVPQSNDAAFLPEATNKAPIRAPFSVRMRVSAP